MLSTLLLASSPSLNAQAAPPLNYLKFDVDSLLVPASERCRISPREPDLPYALAACEQAASGGDPKAQFLLGNLYYEGVVIPRDTQQAMLWFQRASLQGHAQAQYQIAFMLYRGEGTAPNLVEAYIMMKMSAVNGFDEAISAMDLFAEELSEEQKLQAFYTLSRIFKNYRASLATSPDTQVPLDPADPSGLLDD
ncbi:sel1 repeat family protein [Aestuariirhabdus litorea]|uniref:Sel1 repeat family protein n=2 Tax=Aestuariirhabdus litorea TaxID=2528527 RepID=A0A3P3VLH1_9GAMM|nr:sel1 repeat family protein [Aestuariirhabdus litorea]